MKKLNIFLLILCGLISLQGCATAHLPLSPNTYVLKTYPNFVALGIPQVKDMRGNDKVGSVGGAVIKLSEEKLSEFATDHLIHYLNTELKVNLIKIEDVSDNESFKVPARVAGIVSVKLQSLNMFSLDALLQPVEAGAILEVVVYGSENGLKVYSKTLTGNYRKRLNSFAIERSSGEIIEGVILDAFNQLSRDEEFVGTLRRLGCLP